MSSPGPAAAAQSGRMGTYQKMTDVTRNGKPVWKMMGGNQFIFYDGKQYLDTVFAVMS